MSLKSFMDEMSEEGEKIAGGGPGSILQVKVEFGFHKYIAGQDFWTSWVPVAKKSDQSAGNEACYAILRKYKSSDAPKFGIHTHMFGSTALPNAWKGDSREFIASWQKDTYELLKKKLTQVQGLEFNKTLWARVKNVHDPYSVSQGESGKTVLRTNKDGSAIKDSEGKNIYDHKTIKVVTEVFPNEAAAQKAADGGSASNNEAPQLSALAVENGVTIEHIKNQASDIARWRKDGKDDEWIARTMGIEPSDLHLEIPF